MTHIIFGYWIDRCNMGIPTNIATLLEGRKIEWERIEFKEGWNPGSSLKSICAFANDLNNWGGGYLVIGVRDGEDGVKELVGVPDSKADAWLKDIFEKCKLIQPDYMPVSEVAEYRGKAFIVLWCPGGSTRPYSSPKEMGKASQRINWVRRLSSTVKPSLQEERDLYNLANNIPFDDRPNHEAVLDDLSIMLIRDYLREVNSSLYERADTMDFAQLCADMRIAAGPPEYFKPLNVGLLFFCTQPDRFFPYAQIDIVEFPHGEGGDSLVEHTFKGPLHIQVRDALRYLTNNVVAERIGKNAQGAASTRVLNYPPDALKEALANAAYHKGYDQREPVEVRVLPDRIEVLSHPGADRSISLEGLRTFRMACRRYRNRRIGEFLKELGLTEGRNTGVHKMLSALRSNGSPDPVFETDEERLFFMVTIYAAWTAGGIPVPDGRGSDRGETAAAGGEERLEPAGGGSRTAGGAGASYVLLSRSPEERRETLLSYFRAHPGNSVRSAAKELGVSTATVNRDIALLKQRDRMHRDPLTGNWVT